MNKVLIIGGNGYVGTRLYNYLDFDVDVIDTCWFVGLNKPIEDTIVEDYRNMNSEFFSKYDTIILLAGHSSVKMSEAKSNSCFNNNVKNFIELLDKLTTQKFIYASSSSVYGSVGGRTVNEKYYGFEPYNQYDISKHTADLYAVKSDLEYYGLRFGTVNGYSPVLRTDVMINAMVNSALRDKEIKLFIKDTMRPILGIVDLCRAVRTIIADESGDKCGLYNLASFNKTAEQIAYEVGNTMNVPVIEYESDPTNITNVKNQTKTYNFSISTLKFRKTFKFSFKETVESITESLVSNWDTMKKTDRSEAFDYE